MSECCHVITEVSAGQRRVLRIVLALNLAMFVLEAGAGLLAASTALLADSADMLGDAIVYGVSLYAVGRGVRWQARSAALKGWLMAAFGAAVLAQAALKIARGAVPEPSVMGVVGLLALGANALCLALLWRLRADDVNMRSAWICSRNDVTANAAVLAAAGAVALTGSPWPDIVVGLAIAALFAGSAAGVLRDARRARATNVPPSSATV